QISLCLHGINLFQHRLGRRQTQLVDACLVHAGPVEIPDQLFDAALGPVGLLRDIFQYVFELILGLFACLPAPAPAVHVGGDWVLCVPGSIGELGEVRAGIGFAVQISNLDSV